MLRNCLCLSVLSLSFLFFSSINPSAPFSVYCDPPTFGHLALPNALRKEFQITKMPDEAPLAGRVQLVFCS